MHKRKEDGLVVVVDDGARGCRYCEMRTARRSLLIPREANVMRKCDGCLDRLGAICALSVWILARSERWFRPVHDELRANMARRDQIAPLPSASFTHLTSLLNRIRKRDPQQRACGRRAIAADGKEVRHA